MNTRKNRNYTPDFKQSAVQLALRSPSVKVAAKELSIPIATLTTWLYQFKEGNIASPGQILTPESAGSIDPATGQQLKENLARLLEENRRLNKTISVLEEERLILKKAAAYFAREQR